jgi:predicted porin
MKKSLLAVAAMGAFASVAQAQSSVTVYGILDVGFSSTSSRASTKKETTNGFDQSRETSSRLGFKGTEDLGGGASAFFTAEMGLTPQGDTMSKVNNRQSFVGLQKKGIGAASIGTQYTVVHNAVAATDPGQSNNVVGSIIRPAGSSGNLDAGQYNSSTAYTVSTTNMLIANSDKFAGFGANAMYVANGKNQTETITTATTGGNTNFTGWGISADYTWQKLYATVAYQSFKQEQTNSGATTLGTAPNYFADTTTVSSTTNNTDNQFYGAASYDFGILKAYVNYVDRKVTSSINSNAYLKRTGQQIGVRSYITPTIEGWASIGNGRVNAYGTNAPTANFNAWQLGSNYYLSKRTNLYGIYGQNLTSSTSNNLGGAAASQFAVGLRHTF